MSVCQVSAQTQHIVFSNPNHNNIIPACQGYIKDASVCCHACDWNHWIMFSPATTSGGDLDNIDGNSAPTYFINLNITFNHEICIKVRLEKTNLESAGLHHLCSLLHTAALTAARGDNLQINCRTHIHISVISQT